MNTERLAYKTKLLIQSLKEAVSEMDRAAPKAAVRTDVRLSRWELVVDGLFALDERAGARAVAVDFHHVDYHYRVGSSLGRDKPGEVACLHAVHFGRKPREP